MRTILVTGGSNGLGAAFVKAYSMQPDTHILSLDRQAPHTRLDNVETYLVDLTLEDSILQFAASISGRIIDLVVHSAGVRGLVPAEEAQHPDDVEACETLAVMDVETMTRTFQINTVGTFMLLRVLLPNLHLATDPKVIVMSSRMGSVGNNQAGNRAAGGAYAYRASKAALNTIVRSFAVDEPSIIFVLVHPGRVETQLVRCKEADAISADESIHGLLPLIESWNRSHSGRYYDRFGAAIEW